MSKFKFTQTGSGVADYFVHKGNSSDIYLGRVFKKKQTNASHWGSTAGGSFYTRETAAEYLWLNYQLKQKQQGPCAKQTVLCVLMSTSGKVFYGTNSCKTPQEVCPRADKKTGEGYELCKEVCKQEHHAEVNACKVAGKEANGATVYLFGHSYCCEDCLRTMEDAGVYEVNVYGPSDSLVKYYLRTSNGRLL